jgi:tetratricopeptide (TPR) repeat protein
LVLYSEYGHKYEIVERGDLAILFFTNTPLVSAHLFRRDSVGWRLDIAAEVDDTREFVGGPYTWGMMLTQDDYTRAFSDLFEDFGVLLIPKRYNYRPLPTRVLRPARGDNRPLPTRSAHDPVPGRNPTVRPPGFSRLLLPVVGNLTEDFGYPAQTIDRLAVRRLLYSRSYDTLDAVLSAYADSVTRDYRMEYRLFDAYDAFDVAVPSLEPLLTSWVNQRPTSSAARLARGTYLNAAGWNARGTKFASATKHEQFVSMAAYFRRANADFMVALALSPSSIVAYRGLLMLADAKKDPETTRQLLDRGLKIQPYSFRLRWTYMANLLPRWGGSYKEMTRFAEESAPYAARNPRIRALGGFVDLDKGRLLERDGRKAEAMEAYSRAVGFGNFCEFRYERGELFWRTKRNKAALEDLNRALLQCPQHADALYDRSEVTYALGLVTSGTARSAYFAQAYDDIEMAVALDPTDGYYQRHLAFIRENIPNFAPPPRP